MYTGTPDKLVPFFTYLSVSSSEFLIAFGLSVCVSTFHISSFSPEPLDQFKHSWHKESLKKEIMICSNEGPQPFQSIVNNKRARIYD